MAKWNPIKPVRNAHSIDGGYYISHALQLYMHVTVRTVCVRVLAAWGVFIPPDHQLATNVIELCCLYCSPRKLIKTL